MSTHPAQRTCLILATATLAAEERIIADISPADAHACGREADGTVYCWGANDSGEREDGTRVQRLTPVRVGRFHERGLMPSWVMPIR